ncbi:MAG: lysophospholipase [Bacteroidota bacterium]
MSIPKEFYWETAQGVNIYGAEWSAPEAEAVIGLVHGVGEHCRRYDHLAAFFQANDIACVSFDRQGNGRSGGRRGDVAQFGFFYDEVASLLIECERRYPDRPVFLYGHSLGGNILLNYALKRHPDVAGVILSAPYFQLAFQPPAFKLALGKLMRSIWPGFTQSNPLEIKYLSRNPKVAEAYLADPLVHDKISARTALDSIAAADELHHFTGHLSFPTLIMHGDQDGLTSYPASKAFVERVKGEDLTFKTWYDFNN